MPIDVGNISDANPAHRAEDLVAIEGWMRVAADLGARMVRVNASAPVAAAPPAPLGVTIESYHRLAREARTLGLELLVENHGGITADPQVIVALVEAVGRENLNVLVDIGNFEPLLLLQMAVMQGRAAPEIDVTPLYAALARIAPLRPSRACQDTRLRRQRPPAAPRRGARAARCARHGLHGADLARIRGQRRRPVGKHPPHPRARRAGVRLARRRR